MYPENNSSNSQTASLSGMLFNHRRFAPWYDDRADYNTDAKSYYDYLARNGYLMDAIVDEINRLLKREITFNDTDTIDFTENGDWESIDKIIVEANAKISKMNTDNILEIAEDGLYVPSDKNNDKFNLNEHPLFYGAIDSIQQTVSQSILMAKNKDIYNVQSAVNNAPNSERHATINHLNPSGVIIDTMEILHSGHGAGWNIIQDVGGKVKILFIAQKAGVNKIVSIDYQAGARVDIFDDSSITTYPNPNNEDLFLAVDIKNNQLVGIDNNDTGTDKIYVYNYDEFLESGLGATKQKTIDISLTTLQGVLLDDNHVYIYNSTIDVDDAYIMDISLVDNTTNKIILGRIGQDPQVKYTQSLEGEGLFSWTNPNTGDKSYFIGVATGYAGGTKRVVKLYGWHSGANKQIFDNLFNEKLQSLKLYDGDGSTFTLDEQPKTIAEIVTPGIYYFNGNNFNKFTDKPNDYGVGTSGFFLTVFPNNKGYIFKQELLRLNGRYPMKFERYVNNRDKTAEKWLFDDGNLNYTLKPNGTLTKLSSLNQRGIYYLNTGEWGKLTDVPQDPEMGYGKSGFFVTVSQKNTDGHVIQECLQNTTVSSPVKLVRTAFSETEASQWLIIKNSEA